MKRNIIEIDEERCTGCGLCIPGCPEGALQIVDGKARLVREIYCDGLGACLGECPEDAIRIVEREAEAFDEEAVKAHLEEMEAEENGEESRLCVCPVSEAMEWEKAQDRNLVSGAEPTRPSHLKHWPVQLMLVNPLAEYFQNADLAIVADCVPFAYGNFQEDFIKNRTVVVACPKLDDIGYYTEKLTRIFRENAIKRITTVIMEVPCCTGLVRAVRQAIAGSGKDIPFEEVVIGIKGDRNPGSLQIR